MYHYTDESCLHEILRTRIIRASKNTLFGEGVYLCDLSPDNGEATILINNYGLYKKGITDKAVCFFKFKKNQLKGVYCRTLKRDGRVIWRYPKKTINLDAVWFDYGYTDSSRGPMKKQQHPYYPRAIEENNIPSARHAKISHSSKTQIHKKKNASTSQQPGLKPSQNYNQETKVIHNSNYTSNSISSCRCSTCTPSSHSASKQPQQSATSISSSINSYVQRHFSHLEPSHNYPYRTTISDYSDNYIYKYPPSYVRPTSQPKKPKKEPGSDGWGASIAIGFVTVIGYSLVAYFSK